MKRMITGDIHIGKNTVNEDELFNVLDYLAEQAIDRDCTHFDILGDLLENRSLLTFRVWPRVQAWFNKLIDSGLIVNLMAGNHDFYGTVERAPSNLRSVNINPSVNIIDEIMTDDDGVTWVPWLFDDEKIPEDGKVIFGHLAINGFNLNNWHIEENGMDIAFGEKKIYTGHFHNRQKKNNIMYVGSPIHHTWNDANESKCAYILDADFEIIKDIHLNHLFMQLVKIDYDQINQLSIYEGRAKISVKDVPKGEEELVIKTLTAKGACSVECLNIEEEEVEIEASDIFMTVDQAVEQLINEHEMQLELTNFHQGII